MPIAKMLVLFIGHGSPMNAIADNRYTQMLSSLAHKIREPRAILVVSAHWMTEGTWVTEMERPPTIHDFYGFPQALFDVRYPAPGSPQTAQLIRSLVTTRKVSPDLVDWGLDHGTWAVLRQMYPRANIPVLQMSLSKTDSPETRFRIGEQLRDLREQGILIIGSGNVVHNLWQIQWDPQALAFDWALQFDHEIKSLLEKRDFTGIARSLESAAGRLSHPTADHFLPLHYVLGASTNSDELHFEFEEMQNATISMRTFSWGLRSA